MLPNGSGGIGRLVHGFGLGLWREADRMSNLSAVCCTRRFGNGIRVVAGASRL
jgi:hypothetical protein